MLILKDFVDVIYEECANTGFMLLEDMMSRDSIYYEEAFIYQLIGKMDTKI